MGETRRSQWTGVGSMEETRDVTVHRRTPRPCSPLRVLPGRGAGGSSPTWPSLWEGGRGGSPVLQGPDGQTLCPGRDLGVCFRTPARPVRVEEWSSDPWPVPPGTPGVEGGVGRRRGEGRHEPLGSQAPPTDGSRRRTQTRRDRCRSGRRGGPVGWRRHRDCVHPLRGVQRLRVRLRVRPLVHDAEQQGEAGPRPEEDELPEVESVPALGPQIRPQPVVLGVVPPATCRGVCRPSRLRPPAHRHPALGP